ncbi:DNA sulfur modification protein DndE [bacterium]|nr:DNA sulfur modification protein DndE [bacterium]
MQLNKIKLTKDASDRLKQLKARTGLTPNILSRIGFCMSLNDPSIPNPDDYPEEDREFNRYTLLGEWDALYVAMLRQRMLRDGVLGDMVEEAYFRAHINRGVVSLSKQVRSISDLASLATT